MSIYKETKDYKLIHDNMFNMYETIIVKKTQKLGVIQGIMPRMNKSLI